MASAAWTPVEEPAAAWTPVAETTAPPEKPGFWERAYETSGAKGLIEQAKQRDQEIRDMWSRVGQHLDNGDVGSAAAELSHHVAKSAGEAIMDSPPVAIVRGQVSQIPKAIAAAKAGDYSTAAGRALATVTPLGPQAADMAEKLGTDVGERNYRGAAGDITGFAGPLLAAKGIEGLSEVSPTKLTAPVRAAIRGTNKVLAKAPASVGAAAGASLGGALAGHLGAEIGAGAGALVGKEILPSIKLPGEGFGLPNRVTGGPANAPEFLAQPPAEVLSAPTNPPEAIPPSPTPTESPNASPANAQTVDIPDFEGQASPQTENAAASPLEASPADVLTKTASPSELKALLEESLGAKPLKKGVPLRNQNQLAGADTSLPKDFTPVDSSALKGYKYSPETREFESVTQGGQHYIHGDVSPEEAAAFDAADSKGKAWQKIRENPLVAKVVNGNRVAVVKGKSLLDMPPGDALSQKLANLQDFLPSQKPQTPVTSAAAPPDLTLPDLTSDWEKALADVKAKKGPQSVNAAGRAANPDLESEVNAAPEDVEAQTDMATLANLQRRIQFPISSEDRLQAVQQLSQFETRDLPIKKRVPGETRQRFKGGK